MGILGVQSFMESNPFTCREVNIQELVAGNTRRDIVVDGNLFVSLYLHRKYPWIVCGITEFADYIRDFVQTFRNIGVKLVFFFNEGCLFKYFPAIWSKIRRKNVLISKAILSELEMNRQTTYTAPIETRKTHDVQSWAIGVLRDLNVEVKCTLDNRTWYIASYARAEDCLAILSQSSYFVFYQNLNSVLLSLKHLDLENLTTKAYDGDLLAFRLHLNKKFYPLLATLLGSNITSTNTRRLNVVRYIYEMVNFPVTAPSILAVAQYIRGNYDPERLEDIPNLISKHFPVDAKWLNINYSFFAQMFNLQICETLYYEPNETVSNSWDEIKKRCKELTSCGKLCGKIRFILEQNVFEQFPSLEDYEELPPSSLVYRNLRSKLYGILLHEAPELVDVLEWCIETETTPRYPRSVSPSPVCRTVHPGLLALWNPSIQNEDLAYRKWRLFAAAISPELDHRLLRDLPSSLVVPVAVLYYLFRSLPEFTRGVCDSHLQLWEAEVFLSVAWTLQHIDKDFLRSIPDLTGNVRAIRLANMFIQGCDITNMVVQSCGFFFREIDLSIWKYFDGKLFKYLYDNVLYGTGMLYCSSDNFINLFNLRNILPTASPY